MESHYKENSLLPLPEVVGAPSVVNAGGDSLNLVDDRVLGRAPIRVEGDQTQEITAQNPFVGTTRTVRSPTTNATARITSKPILNITLSEEEELMKSSDEEEMPPDRGKKRLPVLDRIREERVHSTPRSDKDRGIGGSNSESSHSTPGKSRESDGRNSNRENPFKANESHRNQPARRRQTKSNLRKEELRHANFFMRKREESLAAGRELTKADQEHYVWSMKIFKKYEEQDNNEASTSAASGKRNRSHDTSGRGEHKKPKRQAPEKDDKRGVEVNRSKPSADTGRNKKYLDNLPLNEVLKEDLKIVIVDKNEIDLRINQDNYSRIEEAIFTGLYSWITKHPDRNAPIFSSSEKFRGYTVISCDCDYSLKFLRETVGNMGNLWKDAKLDVMLLRELPALPKAYINIPLSVDKKQLEEEFGVMTLSILRAQNRDVPIHKWKILRVGNIIRRSVLLTFAIDKESLITLGKKGNKLTFCMRELRIDTRKGGLIIDEEGDKVESSIEELMESAHIDEAVPTNPPPT